MRKTAKVGISIAVTAILVWVLIRAGDPAAILTAVREANLRWVGFAFLAYAICYYFRALRFRVLLQRKLSLGNLLPIVAVHNLFTSVLPFRSGELSYPIMLGKRGIGAGESVVTLVLARIFDFIAVATMFLVAVVFLPALPSLISGALWVTTTFLVALIAIALFSLFATSVVVSVLRSMTPKALQRSKAGKWIWQKLREVHAATAALRGTALLNITFSTIAIWAFQVLTYAALLFSVGATLSIAAVAITVALVSLASAIPIQGLAGIGTNEAYWTAVLIALGISKETAIAAAFAQHLYVIGFYLVLGGAGAIAQFGAREH